VKTSPRGLAFICQWEGKARWKEPEGRYFPYHDEAGFLTIGVGHLIRPSEDFTEGISDEHVMQLLASDVLKCERAIDEKVKVPLQQNQFDALVAWSFNVGVGALWASTLVIQLNLGRYADVPALLLSWCHAGGKKSEGLLNRRKAEGKLWSTPYPDDETAPAPLIDLTEAARDADDDARRDTLAPVTKPSA
jgi:lysozyme